MSIFSKFSKNDREVSVPHPREVEVLRLDGGQVDTEGNFVSERFRTSGNVPIHQQHLQEMEEKRKKLLAMDQQLVNQINEDHRTLASVRMAIRGVEEMMASIRANPIVPPVIQSVSEFRSKTQKQNQAAANNSKSATKDDESIKDMEKAIESLAATELNKVI